MTGWVGFAPRIEPLSSDRATCTLPRLSSAGLPAGRFRSSCRGIGKAPGAPVRCVQLERRGPPCRIAPAPADAGRRKRIARPVALPGRTPGLALAGPAG
ncbi:MAG: hypothetical protein B7Z04_04695 [Rhodobacterales bacterium 32-66-9]|nr:MAG: hypothetical protein B7Z04_04695 [Rhodobacterales bacterium 32-66-9]